MREGKEKTFHLSPPPDREGGPNPCFLNSSTRPEKGKEPRRKKPFSMLSEKPKGGEKV